MTIPAKPMESPRLHIRPTCLKVIATLALLSWPREAHTTRVREQSITREDAVAGSTPVVGKIRALGKLELRRQHHGANLAYSLDTTEIEVVRTLIESPSFKAGDVVRLVDPAQEQSEIAGALYRQVGLSKHGWVERHYASTVVTEDYAVGKTLIFFVAARMVPTRRSDETVHYLSCGHGYERLALEKKIEKAARAHPRYGGPLPVRQPR